ncbi:alpha/beta-hydrolase [Xylona heveae TC161]|uniref:Kynurenine formamidase n=1 Tax=Xylona heveae (strain CBS 132557 / TC161) TaxID=1328760 RepID=A0A165FGI3_XYLHT|nr:alpha/beta-hydrolase [Xylona heveae TC161]KZF20950.1 alpha/beta-hydrolase [Xylona heveae TC161]
MEHKSLRYSSEHELQHLSVWFPPSDVPLSNTQHASKYWVIYIHGGAWRDPAIKNESFSTTIERLISTSEYSSIVPNIAAFASIDYRLSPHPDFPQDKASTPSNQLRNAKHPDHIRDVQQAIAFLQREYQFGDRYILVGHSCGATLAFHLAMGCGISKDDDRRNRSGPNEGNKEQSPIDLPVAIVGVEGIYDLRGLRDAHQDVRIYHEVLEGAFGPDESVWDVASPAKYSAFRETWPSGKLAVIVHTEADELVEPEQMSKMAAHLRNSWNGSTIALKDDIPGGRDQSTGGHDEVWKRGVVLADVIAKTIKELSS